METPDNQEAKQVNTNPIRDNLGKWVKGTPTPNPLGRGASPTAGLSAVAVMKEMLVAEKSKDLTRLQVIVEKFLTMAEDGNVKCILEIFQRLDGRVKTVEEMVAENDGAFVIVRIPDGVDGE